MLICVADGNPDDYKYEWEYKSENETETARTFNEEYRNKRSYLKLGEVPRKRVYVCRANNTVGAGSYCEITVEGKHCLDPFFTDSRRTTGLFTYCEQPAVGGYLLKRFAMLNKLVVASVWVFKKSVVGNVLAIEETPKVSLIALRVR